MKNLMCQTITLMAGLDPAIQSNQLRGRWMRGSSPRMRD